MRTEVNRTAQHLKSNLKSFDPSLSVYLVHLFTTPTMDVAVGEGEEEEA